jgi:CRP-like cAMP-binding protein
MKIEEGRELLQRVGWLSRQPTAFQQALFDVGDWRHVKPGKTINHGGDENGGVWGIASGQMNMTSVLGTSSSPVADIQLAGSWGGFGPIFRRPRGADATARLPSLILFVPQLPLERVLNDHPAWWRALGELAAGTAFRYGGSLGDTLIRNTLERCAALLLRLSDCRRRDNELGIPITISCSQDEFAALANLSRQGAGIVLRQLADSGMISLGYRAIIILDAGAMRALLDAG